LQQGYLFAATIVGMPLKKRLAFCLPSSRK
jgi:hypothetical protein